MQIRALKKCWIFHPATKGRGGNVFSVYVEVGSTDMEEAAPFLVPQKDNSGIRINMKICR